MNIERVQKLEVEYCCVYCHTTPDGMQYFGVTNNIFNRWHPLLYKGCSSFYDAIIKFGWRNIKHEIIATCLSRESALKLEDELICKARENGTCLNVRRSGRISLTDEYNKNARKIINKRYYEQHRRTKHTLSDDEKLAFGKWFSERYIPTSKKIASKELKALLNDYYHMYCDIRKDLPTNIVWKASDATSILMERCEVVSNSNGTMFTFVNY